MGALAGGFETGPVGPVWASHLEATEVADRIDEILFEPRFGDREPESWWDRIRRMIFERISRTLLGFIAAVRGNVPATLIVAALLVGLVVLTTVTLGRRRADDLARRAGIERILAQGVDPEALERLAVAASTSGDFGEAIRYRFVAGLLRLDQMGRIEFWPGLTSAEASERLRSEEFDQLAVQFDEVVYGHRAALQTGDERSAELWAVLLGTRSLSYSR